MPYFPGFPDGTFPPDYFPDGPDPAAPSSLAPWKPGSTIFEARERVELARTPIYRAVFPGGETFSTKRVRQESNTVDEFAAVDETFGIDEFKEYNDEFYAFPFADHSVLGDLYPWTDTWSNVYDVTAPLPLTSEPQVAPASGWFPGPDGGYFPDNYFPSGADPVFPETGFPCCLQDPETTSPMQIIPEQGFCSVGAVALTITDELEVVTRLMATVVFGQPVQIYQGLHDMDVDDYDLVYVGTVQSIALTRDLAGFTVQLHNVQSLVNKQLFQAAAGELAVSIMPWVDVIPVPAAQIVFFQPSGYILIDEEIIHYTEIADEAFRGVTRGALRSIPGIHNAGAAVQELFHVGPAHPVDVRLQTYYGAASKTCLGLGYHDIDWEAFARARAVIGTEYQLEFFILQEANALEWIAGELDIVTACYPFVTADGRLSIVAFPLTEDHVARTTVVRTGLPQAVPTPVTPLPSTPAIRYSAMNMGLPFRGLTVVPNVTIPQGERQAAMFMYAGILAAPPPLVISPFPQMTEDSIVATDGQPELTWSLGAGAMGQPINDVTINYDYHPITNDYHSFYQEQRAASIDAYGRFPVVINSAGLRFNLPNTAQFLLDRVKSSLDRYEDGAPVVTLRTHLQRQQVDVGTIVELTTRYLPNRLNGTRGVNAAKAEIVNRATQWNTGYVDFTLLGLDLQL
jgi:hypothetical protein